MKLPWKTKGIVLTAPLSEEVDDVVKFIDEYLAPRKFNLVVMQIRYRYRFKRHPECMGYDPLSYEDIKKLLYVCKKNGIRFIPKMNLCGHQSGLPNKPTDGILHGHQDEKYDIRDGLLRAYPEFGEQPHKPQVFYSRTLCLTNNAMKEVVFDLVDELLEVFEADAIHIGCDEVFNMGQCPTCSAVPKYKLYADWINTLSEHVKKRGAKILMWGDRLYSTEETGYHRYESSDTGTHPAREILDKDVIVCDWHYEDYGKFPSIELFANSGFKIMISPWRDKPSAEAFIKYAIEHDKGHIEGLLMTTWCGSGDLAKRLLYNTEGRWEHTNQIADTIDSLF
ncbi:MAG: family 20 glycosylhydrolase [Clostridia bacterium]|nr:family 20 glycosylhydrolase [Clostridia bacterium]